MVVGRVSWGGSKKFLDSCNGYGKVPIMNRSMHTFLAKLRSTQSWATGGCDDYELIIGRSNPVARKEVP
jgi:hypothetical protein